MHLSLLTLVSLILPGAYGAQVTTTTRQSIHGIGASGAWWVNDVAAFPAEVRQNISELLLNQTWGASGRHVHPSSNSDASVSYCSLGAGLTDYRYNLGGGGVGVGTSDRAPATPYIKYSLLWYILSVPSETFAL